MKQVRKQLTRFVIAGIGSTALNFLVYYLSHKMGINLVIASALGYIIGLVNSYHLGRIWVFDAKENMATTAPFWFVLVYAVGGGGMSGIVTFLDSTLGWDYRICWFWGTAFAFVNNFVGSKWLVFNESNLKSGN